MCVLFKTETMKILKGLSAIGIVYLFLGILNACCDKGYIYEWQNIVVQILNNGQPSEDTNISQSEFGLRVNLLNTKFDKAVNYIPDPITKAYATSDCYSSYDKVDTITKIEVLLILADGKTKSNVGYYFTGKTNINEPVNIIDLPHYLNTANGYLIEYFDLLQTEAFDMEATGNFIVNVYLSDERILSDTTQTLNIKL